MELLCRLTDTRHRLRARMGNISWILRRNIRRRLSLMSLRSEEEDSDQDGGEDDRGQDDAEGAETLDSHDHKEQESVICWATAISDHIPSPYDTEGLSFKKGQNIKILHKFETGDWYGECDGRRGRFKFNFVRVTGHHDDNTSDHGMMAALETVSVNRILAVTGLSHLIPRLILNGFDTMESLVNMSKEDVMMLDIMGVGDKEKLETIVTVLRFLTQIVNDEKISEGPDLKTLSNSVRDARLSFAEALAKFDSNPKTRIIPVCGVRPRHL